MSPANPIKAEHSSDNDVKSCSGAPRGQKRPFRPREVWAIRARLEMLGQIRNLALLNLAIDSKLRPRQSESIGRIFRRIGPRARDGDTTQNVTTGPI